MGEEVSVELEGHTLELLPEHAAYWRDERLLLVADLHLGKAQTFQTFGLPVPSGAETTDLERLAVLAERLKPQRVALLGDILHSRVGLRDNLVTQIASSFKRLNAEVLLVAGNHDRAALSRVAASAKLEMHAQLEMHGVCLTHKPLERGAFIAGHVHPRATLRIEGDMVKLPCFVLEGSGLTLPAFSSFAAGANMARREGRRRFVIAGEHVLPLDD
jgi:DNA ligase-associated metallophosphoesterase